MTNDAEKKSRQAAEAANHLTAVVRARILERALRELLASVTVGGMTTKGQLATAASRYERLLSSPSPPAVLAERRVVQIARLTANAYRNLQSGDVSLNWRAELENGCIPDLVDAVEALDREVAP